MLSYQDQIQAGYFRFKLGDFACVCLSDGFHDYQLEQMFANAPRTDVEAALQAHGLSHEVVHTPYTYLYVNTGQHQILVDTGAGNLFPTTGKLLQNIEKAGIILQSIDAIFISHAHPDHVGGVLDEHGEVIFTQATYYISKSEWDFWFSDQAAVMAGGGMTDFARQKLTPIKPKTVVLERDGEVLPGVSVLFTPGHTPGHMAVSFSSQNEQLIYIGDTVLHPLHLEHPDWLPEFDVLPEAAQASKHSLFDFFAAKNCWVIGQHFRHFQVWACDQKGYRLGMAAFDKGVR
jgi:glyoxylase-like metal-dependent hydrolase (beta-lactamase superfamily II)